VHLRQLETVLTAVMDDFTRMIIDGEDSQCALLLRGSFHTFQNDDEHSMKPSTVTWFPLKEISRPRSESHLKTPLSPRRRPCD
jgi:hypothetical protein